MSNLRKIFLGCLFAISFLFAYFVKCQLDICFINNFFLDKYPPLSLLQNRNPHHIVQISNDKDNLLVNRLPLFENVGIWNNIWMDEKGKVVLRRDFKNIIINSKSSKDWTLLHKKLFQVIPGDVFKFSGSVKMSNDQAIGSLSVVLYSESMLDKKWDYAIKTVKGAEQWTSVTQEFSVPTGVRYICFRLSGGGIGNVWFKDLVFEKK